MIRLAAVPLALTLLLSACARPELPPEHFYRINAVPLAESFPEPVFSGPLVVNRFVADGLLGERAILFTQSDRPFELQQYRTHRWAEAPGLMLADALTLYLRSVNLASPVVVGDLRVSPAYVVVGRIRALERRFDDIAPHAVVEIELRLMRASDNRVVWQDSYRVEQAAASASMADTMLAFQEALTAVFDRFLADIVRT